MFKVFSHTSGSISWKGFTSRHVDNKAKDNNGREREMAKTASQMIWLGGIQFSKDSL